MPMILCKQPNSYCPLILKEGNSQTALAIDEKRRIFEEEKPRKEMTGKSAIVSIILSCIIPGLGDLYCGSWIKALIFFGLDFLSLILMFAAGFGIFLFAPVWVCGLISAWLSANKSEKRNISKQDLYVPYK